MRPICSGGSDRRFRLASDEFEQAPVHDAELPRHPTEVPRMKSAELPRIGVEQARMEFDQLHYIEAIEFITSNYLQSPKL